MFERNICQFVPHKKTELDLQPLHFVLEMQGVHEEDCELSVYRACFVLEGEGVFKTRHIEEKLTSGDLFFCLPATKFSLFAEKGFKYFYISYIGLRASKLANDFNLNSKNCVFHNMLELVNVWKNALPVYPDVSDLRAESVLLYSFSAIGSKDKKSNDTFAVNAATETKKYVDAHFADPQLSLSSVCEALSYSPKYLSSIFTKQYNTNFSKYLNSIRVEHACALMERGYSSIKTVSFLCGFNDPLYFSKVFKAHRKVSPKEFIKSIKQNDE